MNIFILDTDLKKNAQYYCDKHISKMILESAQLLCTVVLLKGGTAPYKITHKNHPCTNWLMESGANWDLLIELVTELNSEYKLRYGHTKNHKSFDVIQSLVKPNYNNNSFSGMFNAVVGGDQSFYRLNALETIKAYREYYKSKFNIMNMTWKNREIPNFIKYVS